MHIFGYVTNGFQSLNHSGVLSSLVFQVNYKKILNLNCWLIIISKMLTKFIAFLVTNHLHTMDLTDRKLITLKKNTCYNIQNFNLQSQLNLVNKYIHCRNFDLIEIKYY